MQLPSGSLPSIIFVLLSLAFGTPAFAVEQDGSPDKGAFWSTPGDGRPVMIVRSAGGWASPIIARVRLCVTNFTGSSNALNLFIWTTPNFWDLNQSSDDADNPKKRHLQLGDCAEIDHPAAIIVQDATVNGTASGFYQLLEAPPNLPASPLRHGRSAEAPHKHAGGIHLSPEPLSPKVSCIALQALPNKPQSNDFAKQCFLSAADDNQSLPPDNERKGVRICFGANDVSTKDGPMAYAPSLMDMIVDPGKAPPTEKPSPDDYNWSPVTPNGCRDVIGVNSDPASNISFLIGPNYLEGVVPWVPDNVDSVIPTVYSIYWNEE